MGTGVYMGTGNNNLKQTVETFACNYSCLLRNSFWIIAVFTTNHISLLNSNKYVFRQHISCSLSTCMLVNLRTILLTFLSINGIKIKNAATHTYKRSTAYSNWLYSGHIRVSWLPGMGSYLKQEIFTINFKLLAYTIPKCLLAIWKIIQTSRPDVHTKWRSLMLIAQSTILI